MNSLHEVVADTTLSILLSNFSLEEWRLPKNTVVIIAARSLITVIKLSAPSAKGL